ncbi:MAG: hypothetical protein K1W16_13905 [Lachnospiraceae bacterium]
MRETILILCMLFCHIVDDYYLQGWLASAKQKKWWEQNAPNPLYKNDYIIALVEHAFSWTFMIHVPIVVYLIIFGSLPKLYLFIVIFIFNWLIHIITDNAKANLMKINLIQDQWVHIAQIFVTWAIYVVISR